MNQFLSGSWVFLRGHLETFFAKIRLDIHNFVFIGVVNDTGDKQNTQGPGENDPKKNLKSKIWCLTPFNYLKIMISLRMALSYVSEQKCPIAYLITLQINISEKMCSGKTCCFQRGELKV